VQHGLLADDCVETTVVQRGRHDIVRDNANLILKSDESGQFARPIDTCRR
jgi:hypothetical protein